MRLAGKTAIVTGGGSGFGAGIVAKFIGEGARVMVADINEKAAQAIAKAAGNSATAHAVDVADGASVTAMAEAAFEQFGKLDILVNNAGITHLPQAMEDVEEQEFDRVLAFNAKSVYLAAKIIVPHLSLIHI